MSAQVTKEHCALWNKLYNLAFNECFGGDSSDAQATQIIADSEARAVESYAVKTRELLQSYMTERDQLRTECNNLRADLDAIKAIRDEETARAERAESALATERARLDWLLSRMGGNVLPVNGCVAWTVDVYHYKNQFPSRAAIDAAIKEGA